MIDFDLSNLKIELKTDFDFVDAIKKRTKQVNQVEEAMHPFI